MNQKSLLIRGLYTIGLLLCAAPAMGGSVQGEFVRARSGRVVSVSIFGDQFRVFAGQLEHQFTTTDGQSPDLNGRFLTFCIDLLHTVAYTSTEFDVLSVADGMTGNNANAQAQALADLFAFARDRQFETRRNRFNRNFAAAFQIAVWEIVYDFDGELDSFNLNEGNFEAVQINNGIASILHDMNDAFNLGASTENIYIISAEGVQDQLAVVPIPAAVWLGLAGLGAVIVRRSRKIRRTDSP